MTFEEIIWDVMEIKGAVNDDSDIEELWVLFKINHYRAVHIEAEYRMNNQMDPSWFQRYHQFTWEKVNAADDPAVALSSVTLGKANIPSVVHLPDDQGVIRVSGSSGILQYEPCDFNRLMMKSQVEQANSKYGYYSRVGNILYSYPYNLYGSAILIAHNPLDVPINDNGAVREMTFGDDYPLDPVLAQRAILDLLTKDFAISENAIADLVNDSQSQLKILSEIGRSPVQRNS